MLRYQWPVFAYPSRRCNYRCSYCFTDSAPERDATGALVQQWERFCAEAAELGVPEVRISGGEPLMLPAIEEMCRTIVRYEMRYTITTNGSLLDRHYSWMRELPPETLWISFHREYRSATAFHEIVARAAEELPRVGLNVFTNDWQEDFGAAGASRLKLLTESAVGRSRNAGEQAARFAAPAVSDVEVRIESPTRRLGSESCVLLDRPLLSFDVDARAYACCVTVGEDQAEIGDFRSEALAVIAARSLDRLEHLPCARLVPGIAHGDTGCPVRLYGA